MKKNTIGANPALAAILKSVKTTEKEYKTTQLQPKKKKKKIVKHNLANFELDRNERDHLTKTNKALEAIQNSLDDPLVKVSIVPRGLAALGYAQYLPKEQFL